MSYFITCKEGFEKILTREIGMYKLTVQKQGRGWIYTQSDFPAAYKTSLPDLCFGFSFLENPIKIQAASVNALTDILENAFMTHVQDMRITEPWPYIFSIASNQELIKRAKNIEDNMLTKIQKKMSRVAKLAREGVISSPTFIEGFYVYFIDFDQLYFSFKALSGGQQRMQMDNIAPSRSYLKVEEAFYILKDSPKRNDIVYDLGAAPGGWTYSALKRGAVVTAIDNGPLKGFELPHLNLRHLKKDAIKYKYDGSKPADWLLCDILEQPDIILELLNKWITQKWCRNFIVNLKVGLTDPIMLLKKIHDPKNGISPLCQKLMVRQLYHDREEITLMGSVK